MYLIMFPKTVKYLYIFRFYVKSVPTILNLPDVKSNLAKIENAGFYKLDIVLSITFAWTVS